MKSDMSYISRVEKEQQNSHRNKRSDLILKRIIITAVALSIISFIVTVAVIKLVTNENTNATTVVAPKLAGAGVQTEENIQTDVGTESKISNPSNVEPSIDAPISSSQDQSEIILPDGSSSAPLEAVKQNIESSAKQTKTPKVIYLTFDDGPSKYTDEIVDILKEKGIHATFFMIGSQLSGNEKAVKNAFEAGNYIGLHSMSHNKKKLYDSGSSVNFIKEFIKEQALIKKIIGTPPTLIRAPYGSQPAIGKSFRDDIVAADLKMWDWTVDSKDWNYPNHPEKIMKEIKRQVHRDVEVILMHEKSQTVSVLPDLIDYLSKKGYAFAVYKPDQHFSVNFGNDDRL